MTRSPMCELPANPRDDSKEQRQFIEQTVAGLAQEGKVNSVRLALFAGRVLSFDEAAALIWAR